MTSTSYPWGRLLLTVIAFVALGQTEAFLVDGVYVQPDPLTRSERSSVPIFNLIPAGALSSADFEAEAKRVERQSQVVVVNQNQANHQGMGFGGGRGFRPPPRGGGFGGGIRGGFGGSIGGGFGGGFGGRRDPFFGRRSEPEIQTAEPMIGSPLAASYPSTSPCGQRVAGPPCPNSWLFSCQPKLVPVGCSQGTY